MSESTGTFSNGVPSNGARRRVLTTRTLGDLYVNAERSSSGRIITRTWDGASWQDMPGWRFFRQIIRVGLYLREIAGLEPGHRVLIVSRLRAERLVAEWAAAAQGAVVATLGPDVDGGALATALTELSPRVAFVSGPGEQARLLGRAGARSTGKVIVFEGLSSADESVVPWPAVLDKGGTFDTAERAQAFRTRARALKPEAPAVARAESGATRGSRWKVLAHGDLVGEIEYFNGRSSAPEGAPAGDLAYAVESPSATEARIALYALVAGGKATIAIGTPGREAREIAELRPRMLVGAPAGMHGVGGATKPGHRILSRAADLLRRMPALEPLAKRIVPRASSETPEQEAWTLDGMRVQETPQKETTP